ncbi:hypothetical protein GGH12_000315 [Coemansia sp. RSA 1822]|nr:hypothetical protein LPJ76_000629 [Coemansia sp. RSA 638]KAJ2124011.1 hypothetical protein IW147_002118 [Coemansia sp. RSA 720]KAJ2567422.1 hypothetical protein GGH12_000315 [Coemansia sp. RSA 1822]
MASANASPKTANSTTGFNTSPKTANSTAGFNTSPKAATPNGFSTFPKTAKAGAGCPHIAAKTKMILERLKVLVPYASVCSHRQALLLGRRGAAGAPGNREATPAGADGDRSRKRLVDEMPAPACFQCSTAGDRLHACLGCDHFACWRSRSRRGEDQPHIAQHLAETGHAFALDFVHQQVYCAACGDYVYDATVQAWQLGTRIRWHAALCDSAEPEAKRPRIVSAGTDLSPAQAKYLREHGAVAACGGVRGLHNLGATCYLSVVLQALTHNPLVRGWMLSDGHHPSRCRVGRLLAESRATPAAPPPRDADSGSGSGDEEVLISGHAAPPPACMACELEAALQAVFADEPGPFAPVQLLRTLWLLRSDLAGYGQHDAHECLGALLDTLHVGFTENALGAPSHATQHSHTAPCPCLVHQAFAGVLQSTVTCAKCGNATHTHDPILDISLDIPPPSATRVAPRRNLDPAPDSRHSYAARATDAALNDWLATRRSGARSSASMTQGRHPVITLQDCLAHYTRTERLLAGAYVCSRCRAPTAASKQLCLKELPPVLTFQLKRFNHSTPAGSKVDTFVRLPLTIDMTPYTASAQAAHAQSLGGLRASAGVAMSSTGSTLPSRISDIAIHDAAAAATAAAAPARDTPVPVLDGPGGSTTLGKRRTDATHSNPACTYRLFSVVNHIGHLDTGHYTVYALHRGQWYLFDDANVTRASVRDVLGFAEEAKARAGRPAKGKAYMAFYVKSVLDYHDMPAAAQAASPASNAVSAGMGASNTRISESGEWIEDAGVVRTRINPNGDVKIERRGRKKGSTNVRKPKPKISDDVDGDDDDDDDELPFTINPMALNARNADTIDPLALHVRHSDSSDSDGEALWSQISKEKGNDLVPMAAVHNDRPLFTADMASSPADKLSFTPAVLDDEEDDDEDNSDFAM